MDQPNQSRAPLMVAIVLLLLPVLYLGSYLALVVPEGKIVGFIKVNWVERPVIGHYRTSGDLVATIFWPLEQIDRQLRPGAWDERRMRMVLEMFPGQS